MKAICNTSTPMIQLPSSVLKELMSLSPKDSSQNVQGLPVADPKSGLANGATEKENTPHGAPGKASPDPPYQSGESKEVPEKKQLNSQELSSAEKPAQPGPVHDGKPNQVLDEEESSIACLPESSSGLINHVSSVEATDVKPKSVEKMDDQCSADVAPESVTAGSNDQIQRDQDDNCVPNGHCAPPKFPVDVHTARNLKRPLPDEDLEEKHDLKKVRIFSTPIESLKKRLEEATKKLMEFEKDSRLNKNSFTKELVPSEREVDMLQDKKRRLRKLTNRELRSVIMQQFVEKLLYQHELGSMKALSDKLETTLETNRKKTAQFHKEIEDMKKVTNKLQTEHLARKNQVPAPIYIKRSVGIQTAANVINKSIMNVSANTHTITPSKSALDFGRTYNSTARSFISSSAFVSSNLNQVSSSVESMPVSTPSNAAPATPVITKSYVSPYNNQDGRSPNVVVSQAIASQSRSNVLTTSYISNSVKHLQNTQMVVMNPPAVMTPSGLSSSVTTITPQRGNSALSSSAVITSAPHLRAALTSVRPTAASGTPQKSMNAVIDLTDEEESQRKKQSQLTSRTVSGGTSSTQLVQVSSTQSPGSSFFVPTTQNSAAISQILLVPTVPAVPSSATGAATFIMGTVPTNTQASRASQVRTVTSSVPAVITTPVVPASMPKTILPKKHPAPLPAPPPQKTSGNSKMLPPQPNLKLSKKDNSIVLSWYMTTTAHHEAIGTYQLYAYQEGTALPDPKLWKKVGSVKALDLPMACTLTQFMPGHTYHFAVRAVDVKCRLGPFSEPKSITLDK